MRRSCLDPRGENTMMSSKRFKNSGLKCIRIASWTALTAVWGSGASSPARVDGAMPGVVSRTVVLAVAARLPRPKSGLGGDSEPVNGRNFGCSAYGMRCSAPRLLVRIMTVFLKSTTRPCPSVSRPSSSTCSKICITAGCAFSTSSNRMTLNGDRRTASVSCPPCSWPTYPGGAPTSRATLCFSLNSLMSMRTMCFSSSNSSLHSALASCVLPTPVGPANRKLPTGRLSRPKPERLRRTASATACTASGCPTTASDSVSASPSSFVRSLVVRRCTGMEVQRDTTAAISSTPTSSDSSRPPLPPPSPSSPSLPSSSARRSSSWRSKKARRDCKSGKAPYLRSATLARSRWRSA
mmetsp:Transcript_115141/g.161833  ORF Transcript_115141/g.161833 Transcript_115141/m.161833 type:complete len:352 (+) Transcript_115141:325-1380(+)